jgi:hypothetical protein
MSEVQLPAGTLGGGDMICGSKDDAAPIAGSWSCPVTLVLALLD